ncbi:alpha/beta fold hydrolase [Pseudonocardia ailaonensis]|uniref:Alpha/beta fold hydrolase n=1 Tax=Pseudonocardia ailaonensis TaxID=367279 RepID=A0ABN2MR70_9PSEU
MSSTSGARDQRADTTLLDEEGSEHLAGTPVTADAPSFDRPYRYLARHGAQTTARTLREAASSAGSAWLSLAKRPWTAPTRTMLWASTMVDRAEPRWRLEHEIALETDFAVLRDFTRDADRGAAVVPTLVLPPQAGHSSTVADFAPGQSQLAAIRESGLTRLYALDWRPATSATKHVTIDDYIDVVDRSIRRMGGRANLVGDCQGGWLAAIYATLHPERVHTLTLAGAPIDFHAGDSVIAASTAALAGRFGMLPYRGLVAANGGTMSGAAVLSNFVMMQPQVEIGRQLQLLAHIDDAQHVERYRVFEDWFKHTQDIPGAFYLWLVENLFWRNRLVRGELTVGGRPAKLGAISCPLFLLAGATDHITPPAQLFAIADHVSTPAAEIVERTAAGGHLGLFTGKKALAEDWPALMAQVFRRSVDGLSEVA